MHIHGGEQRGRGWIGAVGFLVLIWVTPSYADDAIAWVNSLIPSGVAGTNDKQCAGLDERWQLLREQINKKHDACLAEQAEAAKNNRIRYGRSIPTLTEDGALCTYEACEGYHSLLSGKKAKELREVQARQTKACQDNVQKHQQYKKSDAERAKAMGISPQDREAMKDWVDTFSEGERRERLERYKEIQSEVLQFRQEEMEKRARENSEDQDQGDTKEWTDNATIGRILGGTAGAVACGWTTAGGYLCAAAGEKAGKQSGATIDELKDQRRRFREFCLERPNACARELLKQDDALRQDPRYEPWREIR